MAAYGGMERHVCVLAEEAARRGNRVRLLTTSNSLNKTTRTSLTSAGVDLRELSCPRDAAGPLQKLWWLWRQTQIARFTRWDVIYTNGQSALARIVWQAARRHTRIIHHHHTAADAGEQATWAPRFRQVLAQAPEVVACSEATRANIEHAIVRKGARFLPYFSACPVAAKEVIEKKYQAGQPLKFGFAGRRSGLRPRPFSRVSEYLLPWPLPGSRGLWSRIARSRRPRPFFPAQRRHAAQPDRGDVGWFALDRQ